MDKFIRIVESWLCQMNASDWMALAAILISMFGLYYTIRTNVIQRRLDQDKELLSQLITTLSNAYSAIAPTNEGEFTPQRDRLAWLTCSRRLLSYRKLKAKLQTGLYKNLTEEHEEHWRHQFFCLLEQIDSKEFYSWMMMKSCQEQYIEPRSAVIIHRFATWPNEKRDPIETVEFADEVKKGNLFSVLHVPFRQFIEKKFPDLFNQVGNDK